MWGEKKLQKAFCGSCRSLKWWWGVEVVWSELERNEVTRLQLEDLIVATTNLRPNI